MQGASQGRVEGTTAVIMASGFSSRMGRDKLLLPFRGKPLVWHALNCALSARGITQTVLVARDPAVMRIGRAMGAEVVENHESHLGVSQSVRLGTLRARGDACAFFTADQPLLDAATVEKLLEHVRPDRITIPVCGGKRGAPCVFARAFYKELTELEGDVGGKQVIRAHPESVREALFDDPSVFMDVDDVQTYMVMLQNSAKEQK